MFPPRDDLFSDEELIDMVSQQRFQGSNRSEGLHDQVESNVNRAAKSAYSSSIKRGRQETPELAIVAGVLLLRLLLWSLFRKAQKQGLEISML